MILKAYKHPQQLASLMAATKCWQNRLEGNIMLSILYHFIHSWAKYWVLLH